MEKKTFSIPKISCNHCIMTITRELNELDGVAAVKGDALAKTVEVAWNPPASEAAIRAALNEINFPPE